jgi:lipid-binding SYLF domain-containing protein
MATLWERVKGGSKTGFDKAYKVVDKLGPPVNKLSNKLGSEAFWPTTLDKESDKAARILKSFCKDGFYAEEEQSATDGPTQKQKVLKKIPAQVIKNARALAIFTTMRTGLWMSGAGGSGILIAKKEDGTWSPPSGIMLHTAGLGFMVGIDIYDCVVVINSTQALEAFYKIRCTLGSEVSVAAGPIGAGGVLETEVHKRQAPIFTYMKSRGFYAGVQIDGTIVIERTDENERFYGQKIGAKDILNGKVQHPPVEVKRLLETIKAAQGDTDIDENILPSEPPPGDYEVDDGHFFGVPDNEDPDPYGVLALEKEGMAVRDAGTHERASWEQFSFNPSPTSPIHAVFAARTSGERPRSIVSRPAKSAVKSAHQLGAVKSTTCDGRQQHPNRLPRPACFRSLQHERKPKEQPRKRPRTPLVENARRSRKRRPRYQPGAPGAHKCEQSQWLHNAASHASA